MTTSGAPKIFGIGLSKTGTSSLAQALQILGFRTLDNMGASRYVAGDLSSIDLEKVEAHDALTDTPIPSFYRELDRRYPGSKFILTVREREGWLKSCMKQFSLRFAESQSEPNKRLFVDLYGTNVFDAEKFARGYDRFVVGVTEYFRDRTDDLLVLNVTAGEGWERLCPFLAKPVPDIPFPKANVTQIRWMKMEDLVAVAEEAGRALLQRYQGQVATAAVSPGGGSRVAGRRLLDRAMQVALGLDATEAALRSSHRSLVSGLNRLNAEIPVLSPVGEPTGYADRKHWNHVWLVDPLDGRTAFVNGQADFSVNIALIEDGRPIYGVVHAPAKGLTYYGRIGKGAFRQSAGAAPVHLALAEAPRSERIEGAATEAPGAGRSVALHACAWLESPLGDSLTIGPAAEWDLAAAHAILGAAGLRIRQPDTAEEVVYNRPAPTLTLAVLRERAAHPR